MYTISCEPASIRIYRPGPAGARWVFSAQEFHRCSTRAPSSPGRRVFLSDSAVAGSALRRVILAARFQFSASQVFFPVGGFTISRVEPAGENCRAWIPRVPAVTGTGENFPSLFSRLWQHQAVHRNTHIRNLPRPSMPRAKGLPCGDRSMASGSVLLRVSRKSAQPFIYGSPGLTDIHEEIFSRRTDAVKAGFSSGYPGIRVCLR